MDNEYPWFPSSAPYYQEDYKKEYLKDRHGTIWLLVRDGGMVSTSDYAGKVWTAGLRWLEYHHGPLEEVK